MKNVVLAFQNYHDVHNAFPLGCKNDVAGTWALYVLPFIEQAPFYSSYNFNRNYNNNDAVDEHEKGNTDILRYLRIPVYTCPSDGNKKSSYDNYMHHNYVVCMGNGAFYQPNWPNNSDFSGSTRGRGWAPYGTITELLQKAMFWGGCSTGTAEGYIWVTISTVTDGLSNTIALSETVQGERAPSAHAQGAVDLRGLIWWGEGSQFTTYRSPNSSIADNHQFVAASFPSGGTAHNPKHPIAAAESDNRAVMSARSFHSGGVNTGMGDGSVRFRSDTININTWHALGAAQSGKAISGD